LAKNIEGAGGDKMGIAHFNLRMSPVRKSGKFGLNQPLVYIHLSPPLSPQFFYLPLFNTVANRKPFLGRKNIEGTFIPLLPPCYVN
jgi:hypothetical protein